MSSSISSFMAVLIVFGGTLNRHDRSVMSSIIIPFDSHSDEKASKNENSLNVLGDILAIL